MRTKDRPHDEAIRYAVSKTCSWKQAATLLRASGWKFRGDWLRERCNALGLPKGTTGPRANKINTETPIAAGTVHAPDARRGSLSGKTFIFTSAQNNTLLHEGFWNSLLVATEHKQAELIISRFVYNKQGFQNGTTTQEGVWYDARLEPYLRDESLEVCPGLVWCGELNILPTAVLPLSTLKNYTRENSGIVPHTKVAMESVPTMKNEPVKFMYTTGAVTQRNYREQKAGQVADFHHVFGALLVEVDEDGDWFARHLVSDKDGCFYDLTERYTPSGVEDGHFVEAITHGDIHLEKLDNNVAATVWGPGGLMDELKPSHQFVHDLIDFSARNHHNIKDPHFLYEMQQAGKDSVELELRHAGSFLNSIERGYCRTVVVESNHDRAMLLWLKNPAGQMDPKNARYWHELNARLLTGFEHGYTTNLFRSELHRFSNKHTVFLFVEEDESYVICQETGGIECGMHGHLGPNGARGNPKNLKTIGKRANTAHTHSAGIIDGVYTTGVYATLDMKYNKGPSGWSHSCILTYPNSKRAIVTMKNNKWRRG